MAARMPPEALERIVERLERAAAELRSGDLAPERAAALVDECARLAAEAGAELDREVRAADAGPGGDGLAGQLALEP
jgi:exonuclease VII small subunit